MAVILPNVDKVFDLRFAQFCCGTNAMGAAKKTFESPNDVFWVLAGFGMDGEVRVRRFPVYCCRYLAVVETTNDAIKKRNLFIFFKFDRKLDAWMHFI